MTRVLVLTLIFPPDGVSTAQLLGEIAEDLSGAGDEVSIVTTSPHYNHDAAASAEQPLRWRWHRLVADSTFKGMEVMHVRMPSKSGGSAGRIAQWVWFHVVSTVLMFGRRKTFDSVLTVSPPPTVALVASLFKRINGSRVVFAVWELYPEILVTLRVLRRGSPTHRVLQWLEKQTYEKVDAITVLHAPMLEAVIRVAPSAAEKTTIIPTFADTDFLSPADRMTALRDEYELGERFVVGYAGNLGTAEDLTPVFVAAEKLPEVVFLISGDGTERERLEKFVAERGLDNVVFTGQLPYARVPEITATADVCLVVLSPGVGGEALPSKVYRIMSCGRPVLAITEHMSPLGKLVHEGGVGLVAAPEEPNEIVAAIETLLTDDQARAAMREAARTLAVERFSRGAVTQQYRELLTASPALDRP